MSLTLSSSVDIAENVSKKKKKCSPKARKKLNTQCYLRFYPR